MAKRDYLRKRNKFSRGGRLSDNRGPVPSVCLPRVRAWAVVLVNGHGPWTKSRRRMNEIVNIIDRRAGARGGRVCCVGRPVESAFSQFGPEQKTGGNAAQKRRREQRSGEREGDGGKVRRERGTICMRRDVAPRSAFATRANVGSRSSPLYHLRISAISFASFVISLVPSIRLAR